MPPGRLPYNRGHVCSDALVEWPRSVHANVSYVLMFLSCSVPGKLSRCLAEQCLHRLQRLAPACVFVQGLALQLRLQSAEEVSTIPGLLQVREKN